MNFTTSIPTSSAAAETIDRRSVLIDALRSLALFGVIVMNIGAMEMRFAGREVMAGAGTADFMLMGLDLLFVQGKARACFAFLFGLGFGILMMRASATGTEFVATYRRRMLALLGIGLINQAFLFWGDILALYALLGLTLMAFRNLDDRLLMRTSLALLILPPVLIGGIELMIGERLPGLVEVDQAREAARGLAAMTSPSYIDAVSFNYSQAVERRLHETPAMIIYDAGVLGLFLLGLWAARKELFSDIDAHRRTLGRVAWIAWPAGLAVSAIYATRLASAPVPQELAGLVTAASVGPPLLAAGYMASLALLFSRRAKRLQKALAPAGRMALTNYLLSGALGGLIFYGYGFGMLGEVGIAELNLLALLLFLGLMLFSALWLSAFRHGPVEWVWRGLAYGRLPRLRR